MAKDDKRILCFYARDQVQLIWDPSDGREHTTVPLVQTEEFKFFAERLKSPLIEVKDLRHALRVKLRKTYADAALVDVPDGCQLVIAKDAMVEGVHYLPDDPPESVAWKLAANNSSDRVPARHATL